MWNSESIFMMLCFCKMSRSCGDAVNGCDDGCCEVALTSLEMSLMSMIY